jgi:hypothetical protein
MGVKVLIGDGKGPATDNTALEKWVHYSSPPQTFLLTRISLLAQTTVDQYEASKKDGSDGNDDTSE